MIMSLSIGTMIIWLKRRFSKSAWVILTTMGMPDLKSFDRVAHVYDDTRGMPPEVVRSVTAGLLAALREVSAAPRLLEVGIGTGRIAVPLAAEGLRITGIDISSKMLAELREKRHDIDVLFAEAALPPFRDASFDAALFVHILHLVPDAEATVRAALPLVRSGGMMIRGQEERPPGSLDERLGDILQRMVREVCGIEMEGRERHARGEAAFERVVREYGARLERRRVAEWHRPMTARQVQDGLARKDMSGAWQIPDAAMPELLDRLAPLVEAVFGGMDVEAPAARAFDLHIARLP